MCRHGTRGQTLPKMCTWFQWFQLILSDFNQWISLSAHECHYFLMNIVKCSVISWFQLWFQRICTWFQRVSDPSAWNISTDLTVINYLVSESLLNQVTIAGKYTEEHIVAGIANEPIWFNRLYYVLLTSCCEEILLFTSSCKQNFVTRWGKKETTSGTEDKGTSPKPILMAEFNRNLLNYSSMSDGANLLKELTNEVFGSKSPNLYVWWTDW